MTVEEEQTAEQQQQAPRPKPAKGLQNLGNTCFYNSTMQCLMHTHSLHTWSELVTDGRKLVIKEGVVEVSEKKVEVEAAEIELEEAYNVPLVEALKNFLSEFRTGRNPNPHSLFSEIARKAPRFRGWQQQDAHELLRYLLDGIRTEELKRFTDAILRHLGVENKPTPEQKLMCRAMLESTDRCYVDSVFGGSLLQIIACSKCKHLSTSLEPFLDLSLPLNYGTPSTPSVTIHNPPPNNRREGTPSKHQLKKQKREERKEAKKAAKNKKNNKSNNVQPEQSQQQHENGEEVPNQQPQLQLIEEEEGDKNDTAFTGVAAGAACASSLDQLKKVDDDIIDIDANTDTDDDNSSTAAHPCSSTEEMSLSDDENCNNTDETKETAENGNVPLSPNYSIVLSPKLPEDDDINGSEARTVLNSLKHFTTPENLCEQNSYECANCCAPHNKDLPPNSKDKKTVEATKRYLVHSPPCVLTLHLKRFEQYGGFTSFGSRMRTRKIRGHVDFPFVLDMAPFCSKTGQRLHNDQREVIYSLYGIVVHSGDLGGGHYIAYVKSRNRVESLQQFMKDGLKPDRLPSAMEELNNGISDPQQPFSSSSNETPALSKEEILKQLDDGAIWYYASDSHVRTVSVAEVQTAEAYILFYERIF